MVFFQTAEAACAVSQDDFMSALGFFIVSGCLWIWVKQFLLKVLLASPKKKEKKMILCSLLQGSIRNNK